MRRWLAAALLVVVGWLASPAAVPLYDGVGTPDQPYRYVGGTPAPSTATTTVAVSGGLARAVQLSSSESGPQVLIDLSAGAFAAKGASLTLTARPLVPDAAPPRGTVDSNVYRVTAGRSAALRPDNVQGFLFLRAAVMTRPDPVVVHRAKPTDPWVEVTGTLTGRDILSTPFRALGDYAVVRLPGAKPLSTSGLSLTRVLLLGAGVLALLTITVLLLRRRQGPDED